MTKLLYFLFYVSGFFLIIYINTFAQTFRSEKSSYVTNRFERVKNVTFNSQTSANFFPNNDSDFWEFLEEDTTTLLEQTYTLNFSVSREVINDTVMNNGLTYKKVKWQNEANSVNY